MKSVPVPSIVRVDEAAIGKAYDCYRITAADLHTATWLEAACGATAPSDR